MPRYEMLFEYMMNKEMFLQNDITQLNNNVYYREADYIDHLEMVLAKNRLETAQDVFKDLRFIIRLIRNLDSEGRKC